MGELCRADLWRFFFERPHFHNRSEFNRPYDSASICCYFARFWEVIIVILDLGDLDFLWKVDFEFGYQHQRRTSWQNLLHIRSKSSLKFGFPIIRKANFEILITFTPHAHIKIKYLCSGKFLHIVVFVVVTFGWTQLTPSP